MPDALASFLPWYRTGLAAAIAGTADDDGRLRGRLMPRAQIVVDGAPADAAAPTLHLIGCGDIVGIDPRSVVRTVPAADAVDVEPNYLASIDFFDEDFVWRHTPQAADGEQLLPWLALLVLEPHEFESERGAPEHPPAVLIRAPASARVLPPPAQAWAWAHAAVHGPVGTPLQLAEQSAAQPALGCSRLISPRRLRPGRSYRAFVVPTFESGRCAGLPGEQRQPRLLAWTPGQAARLPCYFSWRFDTGADGDFEALVERLQPLRQPDPSLGRRDVDMSRPLPSLPTAPAIVDDAGQARLAIEGALALPGALPSPWAAASREAFAQWLAAFVNLGDAWVVAAGGQLGPVPAAVLPPGTRLPIVLPPAYGQPQAAMATLQPAQAQARWLEQLNLDPRQRVAAALGAQVVRRHQEDWMARAWAQYGALFAANGLRRRAQLLRDVLAAMSSRYFDALDAPALLAWTSLAHAQLRAGARASVLGRVAASALPVAALQLPLRRLLRRGGPLQRRLGAREADGAAPAAIVEGLASGRLVLAPPWRRPQGSLSLGAARPDDALGRDWAALRPRLAALLARTEALVPLLPELAEMVALLRKLLDRGDRAARLDAAALSPAAVARLRPPRDWIPRPLAEQLRQQDLRPSLADPALTQLAWNFRQAALNAAELLAAPLPAAAPRPALDLPALAATVRAGIAPQTSVRARVDRRIERPAGLNPALYDPLDEIMAHPRFDDATCEPLLALSADHLLPQLDRLPDDSITLLEANWRFIESFLVGLNHEFGRELLWRGYPTDRRGTCFARFWRHPPGAPADIHPIHGWRRGGALTPLGGNRPQGELPRRHLVLLIKGALLRRFKDPEVFAVKAVPNPAPRDPDDTFSRHRRRPDDAQVLGVRFDSPVGHGVHAYGFELELADARSTPGVDEGWYFVIAERYGEPRFGLDASDNPPAQPATADELDWRHLVPDAAALAALERIDVALHQPTPAALALDAAPPRNAAWGADGAQMAALLLQRPFRMYFHADDMLPRE